MFGIYFRKGEIMESFIGSHDLGLVALSYVISTVGAFVSLYLAEFIVDRSGRFHYGWLTLAAVVFGGCAIWAMHFTGMLAYRMEGPVTYDVNTTLLSLLIPVVLSGIGLFAAYRWQKSIVAWLLAGLVFGLGVAAMHYLGMRAMRMPMEMTHDNGIVYLSVGIAIAAATAALRIIVHWKGALRLLSPLIMGLAVCGMHYTAMVGMNLEPMSGTPAEIDYFAGAWTENSVGFLSGLWVTLALFVGAALAFFRKMSDVDHDRPFAAAERS
jgi:NO-binding membrane sensor protein with MHYT domain